MGSNRWNAILAAVPLNTTAALGASRGYRYEPDIRSRNVHDWEGPPAILALDASHLNNSHFVDLTGQVIGRLTVLGMALDDPRRGQKGALWVCRCACGKYVGQRTKSLKAGSRDRCDDCEHNARLMSAASGNNARLRAESEQARKW